MHRYLNLVFERPLLNSFDLVFQIVHIVAGFFTFVKFRLLDILAQSGVRSVYKRHIDKRDGGLNLVWCGLLLLRHFLNFLFRLARDTAVNCSSASLKLLFTV